MICVVNKTRSTHEHIPISCYSHTRSGMNNLMPIHIGMQESLGFSMSTLSTTAQSQHHLKNNGSISFGSDGLGEMFHSTLGGRLEGCTVLGSWMPTMDLVPSAFWTLRWSYEVFTLSRLLRMAKHQIFSTHLNRLQGCRSRKSVIGSTTISTCESCSIIRKLEI